MAASTTTTDEVKTELNEAVETATEAQKEHESSVTETHKAEETVAKAVSTAKENVQSVIQSAKEAREQAEAYDAEEQAAAQGDIIGISEALALVEQEQKANKMARQAEMQALRSSVEYMGTAVVETTGMVLDNMDALLAGAKDGVTDAGSMSAYLGTVAIGAGAGLFFRNETVQNMVMNGLESFTGLGGEKSEVEEKFVAGVTTPEEQAEWLAENGNGVPNDPYGRDTADPAEDKDFTSTTKAVTNTGVEATEASESELGDLADLDKVTSGESLFGDSTLGKWMDNVVKMFDEEDKGKSAPGMLVGAIVDTVAPGLTDIATTMAKVGPNLAKLMAAKDQVDENEAQNQNQNNGPQATV